MIVIYVHVPGESGMARSALDQKTKVRESQGLPQHYRTGEREREFGLKPNLFPTATSWFNFHSLTEKMIYMSAAA